MPRQRLRRRLVRRRGRAAAGAGLPLPPGEPQINPGIEALPVDDEIGPRRDWREGGRQALKRWTRDTRAWMSACANTLRPGGHLVIVVGDGLVPGGVVDAGTPTARAGEDAGLTSVASASVLRPDHARDDARWEHVFVFQRP